MVAGQVALSGNVVGSSGEVISDLLFGGLHVHRAVSGELELDRLARPATDRVPPADRRGEVDVHLPDVPDSVSVNEAVEITKHYATDESGKFVNGILGAFMRGEMGDTRQA